MTDWFGPLSATVQKVQVTGLHLRALEPFSGDDPAWVCFADLQAALGLDKRSTTEAIRLLVRIAYLTARPSTPPAFKLTNLAVRALTHREGRPLSRPEALLVMNKLLDAAGRNGRGNDVWITAVTATGTALDATVTDHPFVEAQIAVSFTEGNEAGVGMRRIEKVLRYVDAALRIDYVLGTAA